MFKKTLSFTLALVLVLVLGMFTFPAFAAAGITVTLDGNALAFDVPPQLINDRTMVPLRAIFEAMGATVDWNGDTQTVTGTKDSTIVVLAIGSTSPTINGTVVTIDQPGVIVDSRTLAPLRFVAEAFGGTVDWDGNTQTASITMSGTAAPTPPITTTPAAPTPTPTPTQPPVTTMPAPTPAPTQPTTTEPLSGGNIYSDLIGLWGNLNTYQWQNASTGTYEYVTSRENGIELRADGTFSSIVILSGKNATVVTEHRGNYSIGNNAPDRSGSGLVGSILHLTNVMVKETVYVDYAIKQDETFDWKPVQNHDLICGFLNPPDKNTIWFDPYKFDYEGSGDYRVSLTGMSRVVD